MSLEISSSMRAAGLILTNRHITGVGPVRASAVFDRHEELEVPWRVALSSSQESCCYHMRLYS
eukprot:4335201-Amphidinium_carterae.1